MNNTNNTFAADQIEELRRQYSAITGIDPCQPPYQKLIAELDAMPQAMLSQLAGAKIPFVSRLAQNRVVKTTGLACYHSEMGETRPADAVIDASLAHYGKHYFLKTPLTLKGRGVEFLGTLKAENLYASAQHKAGWNEYKVTIRAFEAICDQHKVAVECLLD